MRRSSILVGLLVQGMLGCSDRQPADTGSASPSVPAEQATAATPAPPVAESVTVDCPRGEPKALLESGSSFAKTGPGEAVESTAGAAGLGLEIRHYGCTAYALQLQFTWSQSKVPPLAKALAQVRSALESMQFKADYQPLIQQIITAFQPLIATGAYDTPVSVGESDVLVASKPAANVMVLRYEAPF